MLKFKLGCYIKSLECEASLINLKELAEKRKEKGEVAEKVQRNCKVYCIGCVSSFSGPLQPIFIAYRYQVLTDYGEYYLT